jgi:hypothetical protein
MQISLLSSPRRRLVHAAVAAVATAAIAAGVMSAPASAKPNNVCSTQSAIFNARMNQPRFWIGEADRLADAGLESQSQSATDTANKFLALAEESLNLMTAAC